MLISKYSAWYVYSTGGLLFALILCWGYPSFSYEGNGRYKGMRAHIAARIPKYNFSVSPIRQAITTSGGFTSIIAVPFSEEIKTQVPPGTFCAGDEIKVTYTITVPFRSGNSFIAQLSNESGNFSNPVTIGSVTDFASGIITVRIPVNTPSGNGYRIRTISTAPVVIGKDNGENIAILAAPAIDVSVSGPVTFCTGGSVTLTASSPERNYVWSTGATSSAITVNKSGYYSVSVKGANGCLRTSDPIAVTVNEVLTPPTILAFGPLSLCEGYRTEINVPFIEGVHYQWKKNGKNIGVSANALGVVESGEYFVTLTNLCGTVNSDTITISLKAMVPPPIASPVSRCGPGTVTLVASGGTEGNYRWYDASQVAFTGATGSTFITPVLSSNTTFYVSSELYGCESKKVAIPVIIRPAPVVDAGPDEVIEEGQSVQLQGNGGNRYHWSPTDGLNSIQTSSPTVSPDKTTTYTLTVSDPNGCIASDEITVFVRRKLTIPNAFSPNNDGVNDTWEIANIESREQVKLEVFNRWGIKVYESMGYDQPWDGTADGQALPVSTYFYVLTSEGGRQKLTGSVSIIR